jgi:hypothetical protein
MDEGSTKGASFPKRAEVPLARATGQLAREPRFLNSSPSEPESCHTVCSHTILLLLPPHPLPRRPGGRGLAPAPAIAHLELVVLVGSCSPPTPGGTEMQIRRDLD